MSVLEADLLSMNGTASPPSFGVRQSSAAFYFDRTNSFYMAHSDHLNAKAAGDCRTPKPGGCSCGLPIELHSAPIDP